MSGSEAPDSPPALSASTAALLQQFLVQKAKAEEDAADDPFQENWALSQFWYTDETAGAVAAEAVKLAAGGSIACLACPSLFRRLRTHFPEQPAHLLEYDSRFEV
jgi:EEF1A lysine methyltransferase 1